MQTKGDSDTYSSCKFVGRDQCDDYEQFSCGNPIPETYQFGSYITYVCVNQSEKLHKPFISTILQIK